jgi:hypothetical protein
MRIEIDTVSKTIVVLSHTSIKELIENLPTMLNNWEEYSIVSKVEYSQPYVYQYPFTVNPATQPLNPPYYTTCEIGVQKGLHEWYNQPTISIN